ncbi:MAG: hypothetical protein QXJ73_00655 [Candidatus Caldarchaeum sp.]
MAGLKSRPAPFQNIAGEINSLMIMFCICALSRLSLTQIISVVSRSSLLSTRFTSVFQKARILNEKWGYDQSETLNYLTESLRDPQLKNYFTRLKHALKAGVALEDFARIEYSKYLAELENEFEKGLEKLRRLVEAYSTLVSIVSLLMVSFILVSMIFGSSDSVGVMELSFLSITMTLSSTTLIFTTNNLRRKMLNSYPVRPSRLAILERLAKPLTAACLLLVVVSPQVAGFFGGQSVAYSSTALAAAGAPLALHGFLGRRWCRRINMYEAVLPIFLKSFGDYLNATGSYRSAARMLVVSGFGPIQSLVQNIETRIKLGISHAHSLTLFGREMLSNLAEKTLGILAETLEGGARPTEACSVLSEHVSSTLMRDKRRSQITSSLKSLSIPLQAVLATISALMTTLLSILSGVAKLMQPYLMLIRPVETSVAVNYFYTIMVAVAVITALNIYLADGDSVFSFTHYLGMLLFVSGLSFFAMATASDRILSSFAGFGRSMSSLVGNR